MQDTTGTSIAANAESASPTMAYMLEIAWNGVDYVDETARLIHAEYDHRFGLPEEAVAEPGAGVASEASVVLDNLDGRYSTFQAGSPIYSEISDAKYYLKPMRLYAGFSGEILRVFTGYLYLPREPVPAGDATFMCRDRSATIIQRKATTFVYANLRTDEWLAVLCGLVGIASGDRIFDTGTQIIPYAWLDDESPWTEMVDAVAAEGGYLYFDWAGKLRFEAGAHWASYAAHTVSQYTITRSKFGDFMPEQRPQEVYNEVIVEYAPRVVGPTQKLYSIDKPIVIAPSGTHHLVARLQWPATSIITPRTTSTDDTDYVVNLATGDRNDALLTINPATENKYSQRYECDLVNNSADHSIIISKFQVRGTPLLGDPSTEVKETYASVVPYARTKTIRRNPYIQNRSQADLLASFLVFRYCNPRTVYRIRGVPGVPQFELGDRVTLQEALLLSTQRTGLLIGVHASFGNGEPFSMDLDVMDDAALFADTSYFIVGTHKWGAGTPANGYSYLWYGTPIEDSWTDLSDIISGQVLSASYLSTLMANLNYVHGLVMGPYVAHFWNMGVPWSGYIWHKYNYLRYAVMAFGACVIKVNNVTVASFSSGSPATGVVDITSLGLTIGTMYTVTVTGSGNIVDIYEQIDSAWPVTPPSIPTFTDGVVSTHTELNQLRDAINWMKARAFNPIVPHIQRLDGSGAGSDVFPPNWRQAWHGYVAHRHQTLKARIRHAIYLGMKQNWRIKILVDSTPGGVVGDMAIAQYEYTPNDDDALYAAGLKEDKSIALTGGTALNLCHVACYVQRDYVDNGNPDDSFGRDDGVNFGLDWAYEDSANGKITSWVPLPTFTRGDQPTSLNLNKLGTDGSLLAAVSRSANRPTPILGGQPCHIRHLCRWLKYLSYSHSDGKGGTAYDDVRISWADNEATLPKTDATTWATYDLSQASWLVGGAIYRIEGANYVLEALTS